MKKLGSNGILLDHYGVELNPPVIHAGRVAGFLLRLALVAAVLLAVAR